MKRIFIATGSEALKGLTALIRRLCEENLFGQFDDRYIAIDSMESEVNAFNALGERLHTARVKGFRFNIASGDDTVMESFQSSWTAHDVPAGGVGGDRSISGKAVEFFSTIWEHADLGLGNSLGTDDQIVIIGSAFGGTSGGLFPNICEFVDLQILRKRTANQNFKNVQVLGFLLMPEAVPVVGDYPIATNMISLFKDLQTSSWRRRLESERPGFKVPVWAQREGKAFPLFTKTTPGAHILPERGVQGSSLPVSTLYVVPTPTGKRNYLTALLAEQLFVASYLRVDEGHGVWVNRLIEGQLGPAYQIWKEDPCFAGFNMFAMKSGRMVSLKNWFYKSLMKVLQDDTGINGILNGNDTHPVIPGNVKEVFLSIQMPKRDEPLAGVDTEHCSALQALIEQERDALLNPRALQGFQSSLRALLAAVKDSVPAYDVVPAKELMVLLFCSRYSEWNRNVNIELIKKGYALFHDEVATQAGNVGMLAEQMEAALRNAIQYVQKRVKHRVVRNWAFGLSQEDAVFREIATAFDQKFKALLKSYIYACRCARSPFIDTVGFANEAFEFKTVCERFLRNLKAKCDDLRGGSNPYVVDGRLVEPLAKLPEAQEKELGFDPFKTVAAVVYRSCVMDAKMNARAVTDMQRLGDGAELLVSSGPVGGSDLLNADALLELAEGQIVNRYIEIADGLPDGVNPLSSATLADFSEVKNSSGCKTHTPEFKLSDSRDYHYHFVVKQGTMPPSFHMTNSDVADTVLGLMTMPNTMNGADSFLAQDHSIGIGNTNFWKDENTSISPLFGGRRNPTEPLHDQGLWIGTLGVNFQAHDILSRLYSSVQSVTLDWTRAGLRAQTPRSSMTLSEMVRFGVIIEALETKMNREWTDHKERLGMEHDTVLLNEDPVRIVFERDGRVFELPAGRLRDFGFIDNPNGTCQLERISANWVGLILGWIRAIDASGFSSFYPRATFASVRNCETDIFAHLRFSITQEEIQELDAVKNTILNTIKVSGL